MARSTAFLPALAAPIGIARAAIAGAALLGLALLGPSLAGGPAALAAGMDGSGLQPGLIATYDYTYGGVRHLDEVPWDDITTSGWNPEPIPFLDHTFRNQDVFASGVEEKVVMFITGFIHLAQPGDYAFVAKSNDGVRVFIDGKQILEDPDVHRDRFSEPGTMTVGAPGWYPLDIQYFQCKGTAALSLYWQPPGTDNLVPVPADAYRHKPRG